MSELPLSGKNAFVTGGAGGIGAACAKFLARDGASVTLMGRTREALEQTRAALLPEARGGAQIHIAGGDARDKAQLVAALQTAFDRAGHLDICVPTVGGGAIRPLLMHDEDTFREDLDLNIVSAFLAVRYAAPLLAKSGGGAIVCISSDAATLPFPWLSAYSTAKGGLENFVRVAAEELARLQIRVNAVRPGLTRSNATQALFSNEDIYRAFAAEKPLGRLGEPDDIAAGVRYLAGPESSWVTGQSFAIEGGNELRKAPDLAPMVRQLYGDDAFEKVLQGIAPFDEG